MRNDHGHHLFVRNPKSAAQSDSAPGDPMRRVAVKLIVRAGLIVEAFETYLRKAILALADMIVSVDRLQISTSNVIEKIMRLRPEPSI